MEKEKISNLAQPYKFNEFFETFILWQWQSGPNPDPWAENDPVKWTWQNYSANDCLIIEKAFSLKEALVDLENYEVDLKKMIQVDKKFKDRVRRVRRQEKSRFMMEISEPMVIVRDQKTMNQAFGTIWHFLEYIVKRTPEAYQLHQRLGDLREDCHRSQLRDVIQEVIKCIEKGAEKREKVLKMRLGSEKSFVAEAKMIVNYIIENSVSLRGFFDAILRVYTMETFICYWLNELLRSEDCEEINVLTPYLVCLVYTFKLPGYILKYQEPQKGWLLNFFGYVPKQKLCLYRGAALRKEHFELYNKGKVEFFSWNGVTSTSRDPNIAVRFIKLSLEKAKKLNEKMTGVIFKIEAEFGSAEDCQGMIDIYENSCSEYPDEQEVILAPGTKGLKGNKLIRKLEIKNSEIEEHIVEDIENVRKTTYVKKEDFKLFSNTIMVNSLGFLAHYFSAEKLNELFVYNKIRFKKGASGKKYEEIESLTLSEEALERIYQNKQLKELGEKIKNESKMRELDFSIKSVDFIDCLGCVKEMKNLQSLKLRIHKNRRVSKEGFELLCQTIGSCCDILHLEFAVAEKDQEVNFFEKAFFPLALIKDLSLNFSGCNNISDGGINSLMNGLKSLTCLESLSLNFGGCKKISDEGLESLKNGLLSLTSLKGLSLEFYWCQKISDKGLESLKDGLRELKSLENLSLDFSGCSYISDMGLDHLKSGLFSLTSLQHLSLMFYSCHKISDEGLGCLEIALIPLTSLQHLSLKFYECPEISDKGLNHLKSGLLPLKSFRELSLYFSACNKVSNFGLESLQTALISLPALQKLSLNFYWCSKISDEGLESLGIGLIPLESLESLSFCFAGCNEISDKGLGYLKEAFESLVSL